MDGEKCLTKPVLAKIGDCYYHWKVKVFKAYALAMFMGTKNYVSCLLGIS